MKGKLFKIKPADRRHFVDRVHWAPVFVTNDEIDKVISQYAEVRSIKHELYADAGLEGVATGVRNLVSVGDRHQVLHIVHIVDPDTREVWDCLVTIPGRPPMCLRCKKVGYVQKNCNTPFCRHHGQYGHVTEGCSAEKAKKSKRSYASVAAVVNVPLIDMEESGQTETDEDNETNDIDGTAVTGLHNDGVRQIASAEPGPSLHAASPLECGEPTDCDVHTPGTDACSRPRCQHSLQVCRYSAKTPMIA